MVVLVACYALRGGSVYLCLNVACYLVWVLILWVLFDVCGI